MTWERSCGPQRSCEVGSARIGNPEARERWASGSRSSGSSWRPATMTPEIASAMCPATSSRRKTEGSRSIRVTAVSGRPPRPSSASGSVAVTAPSTGDRRQRLAPGEVEVDRARPGLASRRCQRPAGDRAVVEQPVVVGRVGADFAEPPHRGAEELDLVDRLPGPDPAQLGRPVGGEHDQRQPRLVGLADRRVVVGRRGARGAEQRHRVAARLRGAEGEEAGGALVDDHRHLDLRPPPQGQRQRGRARARRDDRVPHAAAGKLLDEGRGERGVGVGRVHPDGT